jgi:large subunit ribosomal protein L24e
VVTCAFCKTSIPPGTGMLYVKNDGKQFRFCKKKCEKSMLVLKRKARTIEWARKPKIKKE